MTSLRAGAATDVGEVRANNQDQFLVAERLFAVADGMGGHAGGEVASLTAVEALRASFGDPTADALADAVRDANRAVWERANERPDLRGMGTTLTAVALVVQDDEEVLAVVNVGDSRAYLLRDGNFDQLTDDHSVPEELKRAGRLSAAEVATHPQRHMLTRVLGEKADVEVDCFRVTPYQGDRLALASDGLFNEVPDDEIARVLRTKADPDEAARELVRLAKAGGGRDNITVIVLDVVDDDDRAARASAALAADPPAPDNEPRTEAFRPAPPPPPPPRRVEHTPSPAAWVPAGKLSPAPDDRHRRFFSLRALVFVVAVLLVLGGAMAAVGWFARGGYYVGAEDNEVVIYKGRPGGLLWFSPTVADRTGVSLDQVRASRARDILDGKEEPSLAEARRYVKNVQEEAAPATTTTTTTTTTTLPAETTTVPTASAPSPTTVP